MTVADGSHHDEQQLVMLYQAGLSVRQAAIRAGTSPTRAHRVLSRSGVVMRPPGGVKGRSRTRGWTPEAETRAVSLYAAHLSLHAVGAQLGRSGETVARHLRGLHVPLREPSRNLAAADSALILRIHAEGMSLADTAKAAGCSPGTVSVVLREAGIEVRSGRPAKPLPAPPDLAAAFAAAGSIKGLARRLHVSESRLRAALPANVRAAARRPLHDGPARSLMTG
jgi:lambda repressor-like predicted transcriptional regulator